MAQDSDSTVVTLGPNTDSQDKYCTAPGVHVPPGGLYGGGGAEGNRVITLQCCKYKTGGLKSITLLNKRKINVL